MCAFGVSVFIALSLVLNVGPQTAEYCIQASVSGIQLFLFTAIPIAYPLYKFKLPRNYLYIVCVGHKSDVHTEYIICMII